MKNPPLVQEIQFGREICGDLEQAERREWWITNGLGGYAAGTIAGTLTRRYHGLLVAPVNAPLGRALVFAKADASVIDGDHVWPLGTNRWGGGAVDPVGHRLIESFHLDGRIPVWRYAFGDRVVEMRIWMEQGSNTTYVAWRLEAPDNAHDALRLRVRLLVNARDHHGQTPVDAVDPVIESDATRVSARFGDWFAFHLRACGGGVEVARDWIENFDLPAERERGLPDRDNHLCIANAQLDLRPGEWVGVVGSLHADASPYLEEAMRRSRSHDTRLLIRARAINPELSDAPGWVNRLVQAADSFVFARPLEEQPDGESVIAGYPWFGDWGRDTMIALPGLTLPTGRHDSARRILVTFARFVDQGMLPNFFPGAGERAEYNTVDAALWYIEAWRAYVAETDDLASLREAFPAIAGIIEWYRKGTRFGISLDERDGLIAAGEAGVQLTWMDAKVGPHVFTARIGKPVEINALWYNALNAMAAMAERLGSPADHYLTLAARCRTGFQRFVQPDGHGLFDVLDGPDGDDATLRPNQILAASLAYSPLDRVALAAVVRTCGRELLASYGLRSLAPGHPDYRPRYVGGVWERDSGYHQGPVWAWLLGHYALAEYRVHGDAAAAQRRLEPIRDHLADGALGTVTEIFDGDPPHYPRGAPVQAWSVACTLEAWWRLERARRNDCVEPARTAATQVTTR